MLAAGMATGFTALERRAVDVAGTSGLVRDLDRLDADLGQWTTMVDLVMGSGQTVFAEDAIVQSTRIQRLMSSIDALAVQALQPMVGPMIDSITDLVRQAASGGTTTDLLDRSDAILEPLVNSIGTAIEQTQLDIEEQRQVLRRLSRLLMIMSWIAGACYLAIVMLTWRWAVSTFSRPLVQLARSAEAALESNMPFTAVRRGPREIQGLAASLEAFAGNLEHQVQDRTKKLRTMLSELDHRVKNNLATVIALCEQTARQTSNRDTFERAFIGRLRAMAAAHELLAHHNEGSLDLGRAVDGVLNAWIADGSGRLQRSGAPVELPSAGATPMCLVLNELATNAAKYGALSNDSGTVQLRWRVEDGQLMLIWSELGGPPVDGPPRAEGLGTGLIEGLICHQLGGSVDWEWPTKGMTCTVRIPL